MSFIGAPSWFITFAPADVKHPISLYYADTQETFSPCDREYEERYRLIAQNPVAGARLFPFMSEVLMTHVLGMGKNHQGVYGDTAAYYGTVEQQGRLTLHMHMLLWIKGALSPQDIRDKIMDPSSDFQQKLVDYLEGVHSGDFFSGQMSEVKANIEQNTKISGYQDPTQTLPNSPPFCQCNEYPNCAHSIPTVHTVRHGGRNINRLLMNLCVI